MENLDRFKLIKQGAESKLYTGTYLGKSTIAKERFTKTYRHPHLDSHLTKERIKAECRAINRCKSCGIRTPSIYSVDLKRSTIFMEYLENSITVKDLMLNAPDQLLMEVFHKIGAVIGRMHENNIIHGDLTTSNFLIVHKNNTEINPASLQGTDSIVVVIDFGLAHTESSAEDKAVDLYVLERAVTSTHGMSDLTSKIFEGYKQSNKNGSKEVLIKYEEVKARGRKRTMVG